MKKKRLYFKNRKGDPSNAPFSYLRFPYSILCAALILALVVSCDSTNSATAATDNGAWLIPSHEIRDGGPGKDGIPALTNPDLTSKGNAGFMRDSDLVIGVKIGNDARAYPHSILDWHEIINDEINGNSIAVTYCPLTGSGIGWDRNLNGTVTTFGVSGLLYNTNLIPYDRATDSEWSQMKLECVHGKLAGQKIETHQVIETTWGTWKKMAPNTVVATQQTGYNRSYGQYPYGDYRTNHNSLVFPVSNDDPRLPRKNRVLGILVNGETKAYPITSFSSPISVVQESFGGEPIVVVGSNSQNFVIAFKSQVGGKTLAFTPLQGQLPNIIKDQDGTVWNVFGEAVSGPGKGQQLQPVQSYIAYWFAWAAFWPATDLYN